MGLKVIILAAGKGSRMLADLPKVLHPLGGIPLLGHVIETAHELNPEEVCVIYNHGNTRVKNALASEQVTWVPQKEILGTGHAVSQALPHINDDDQVLVLYGDVPLITEGTLNYLINETPKDGVGLLVANVVDPTSLGRICRDEQGNIQRIVEHKDATPSELRIKEINTGIMSTWGALLKRWLPSLTTDNQQEEYYLTDVIKLAVSESRVVNGIEAFSAHEIQGVNNRWQLAQLERYYQQIKAKQFSLAGVAIKDFARFDVRGRDVTMDKDVVVDVNVVLSGKVHLSEGSYIGPGCCLENVTVGKNVRIDAYAVIKNTVIDDNAHVGPFTHIHDDCHIGQNTHVGNFVEMKKTTIGEDSKAKHLTYLGNAQIGKEVNVGAGTITCNYDGKKKSETSIKDGAFIGSNTALIAPITIHENAIVGAGSTISSDVPASSLAVTRAKERVVKDWVK